MKKHIITVCLSLSTIMAGAQTQGGISADMLKKIQQVQSPSKSERAIANAIAQMSINNLAKNASLQGQVNNDFCIETSKQNIHDQKSSGRCWMFSSMNVLRSRFARANNDTLAVEYSQSYLFFYDQLEKANLFLQGVINTASKSMDAPEVKFFFKAPLSDGGTFCGIVDLTAKYGLVPKCVQPETYQSENTKIMGQIIESKLREYGIELRRMIAYKKKPNAIEARKTEMLGTVYHLLSLTLGEPVREFTYAHRNKQGKIIGEEKTYTPQQFYTETVGKPLDGTFAMLMNDPRHPYYKVYEVQYDRHTYDGHNWKYINLPMEDIEAIAITSLKDNSKMYSSYDTGKQFDRTRGVMDLNTYNYSDLFGVDFPMTKAERISTFESVSAHAMTLTAVDLNKSGKPTRWKVENSWGADSGQKGYAIMTDEWFREYMFRLVVDKKYVPDNILKLEDTKPTMISYDDPLFGEDE